MSLTVAQLTARLTADTSGFYRGMAVANASMIRSGGIIARVAAGSAIAVGAIGVVSLRVAGNFQESMNILGAVSGATTKQMSAMHDEAIALGKDLKLPNVSAKDAANAMSELAKAGMSVKDIMAATRGVLQLGIASNIGFADSATLVARALTAFHLEGSKATHVADLFTAAANKSTADINDIALGMQQASARFSSTGQTIEDLATSITVMANAGIVGSDAGTSLKTMMNRLVAPTNKAKDLMQELGFQVYDASGHVKAMPQIIGSLSNSLKGMSEEQKNAAMYTLFGSDAIRAATILTAAGVKGFNKMKTAITQGGEAQKFAEARTKGFNGAIGGLSSAAETLAIGLGEHMLPAATNVAKAMTDFISRIDPDKVADFAGRIGDAVKEIFNFFSGSTLASSVLGGFVAAVVGGAIAFRTIAAVTRLWAAAQVLLNTVLLANPIVLIVAALAALAAGLYIAYQRSEQFRNAVNAAFAYFQTNILPQIKAFVDGVISYFKVLYESYKPLFQEIYSLWSSHWQQIAGLVQTYLGFVREYVEGALKFIGDVMRFFSAILHGEWGKAWESLKAIVVDTFNYFWTIIRGAAAIAGGLMKTVGSMMLQGITDGLKGLGAFFKSHVIDPIITAFNAFLGFVKEIGLKTALYLLAPLTLMPGKAGAVARDMVTSIQNQLLTIKIDQFRSKVENDLKAAGVAAGTAHQVALAAALVGKGPFVEQAARIVAESIPRGSKEGAKLTPTQIGIIMNETINKLSEAQDPAAQGGRGIGAAIKSGTLAGVAGLSAQLSSEVAGAVNRAIAAGAAAARASSPSQEALEKIGRPILEGIIWGIRELSPAADKLLSDGVKQWIQNAAKAVQEKKSVLEGAFSQMGTDVMSAFDAATAAHKTSAGRALESLVSEHDAAILKKRLDDARQKIADVQKEIRQLVIDHNAKLQEINTAAAEKQSELNERLAAGSITPENFADESADIERDRLAKIAAEQDTWHQTQKDLEAKRADAMQALRDEKAQQEYDKRVAHLQALDAQQQKEYEAQRNLQKRHLEGSLATLNAQLENHRISWATYHQRLMKLLNAYGIDYKTAGINLGKAFAKGLTESQGDVEAAAKGLAATAAKYLQLHSPAEEGPLASLDTWWKPFSNTLLGAFDTDTLSSSLSRALSTHTQGGYGMSGGGVGTGERVTYSPVYIQNPTFLTGDRSTARELAENLRPFLDVEPASVFSG